MSIETPGSLNTFLVTTNAEVLNLAIYFGVLHNRKWGALSKSGHMQDSDLKVAAQKGSLSKYFDQTMMGVILK